MTEKSRAGMNVTDLKSRNPIEYPPSDMETSLNIATDLAHALRAAIEGMPRIGIDREDAQSALFALASEAAFHASDARNIFYGYPRKGPA